MFVKVKVKFRKNPYLQCRYGFSTTSKSELVSTLITSINKRLQRYESNDAFKVATVLDPRWKLDWCLADEVEDIKSLVNDKVASVGPVNDATIDRADTPPAPKKIKLFGFMGKINLK